MSVENKEVVQPWAMPGLALRLERRLGLGEKPLVRRSVYQRLERMVAAHGQPVYTTIAEVAVVAESKQNPGRWFVAAITLRLAEMGYDCSSNTRERLAKSEAALRTFAERFSMPTDPDDRTAYNQQAAGNKVYYRSPNNGNRT